MTTDLYKLLGIRRNASAATIRRAYRKLAATAHPDRNPGDPDAPGRFCAIQQAYEVLSDPDRRARYDATGEVEPHRATAHPDAEILSTLGQVLASVVTTIAQQGGRVGERDVVKVMRETIERQQQTLRTQRADVAKQKQAWEEVAGRIEVADGEDNALAASARTHVARGETALRGIDAELAKITRALELLARYRYRLSKVAESTPSLGAYSFAWKIRTSTG